LFTIARPPDFHLKRHENLEEGDDKSIEDITISPSRNMSCMDYIFYSEASLKVSKVLSIPLPTQLSGQDPRETINQADMCYQSPPIAYAHMFNKHATLSNLQGASYKSSLKAALLDKNTNNLWGGTWVPFSKANPHRFNNLLPDTQYGSEHVALCAEIYFLKDYFHVEWR
jgi:hypothetical protein